MHNELIDTISLYLQKNILENKSNGMEEGGFSYVAAKAKLAGKEKFNFGGKEHPVKMSLDKAQDIVNEVEGNLQEKNKKTSLSKMKKRNLPSQYGAGKGTKRRKALDKAAAAYADGDVKKAARIADAENAKQRKKGISKTKRHDTGKYVSENTVITSEDLSDLIYEVHEEIQLDKVLKEFEERLEEKRKKRKKKKKSGKSSKGLSAAVKKSLNKKADKRCLTRGSVYSEFRKGLAAYLSSGSRKGMTAHQWAHARVNSANPSKSWATVKKRKTCPKKKKK